MLPVSTVASSSVGVETGSNDPAATPPGLRAAFRVLLQHLGDHLDLLRLETRQELSRFGSVVICWVALALVMQLFVMFGLTLLMASYWNTEYRTHTIVISAALLLGGALYCVVKLKNLGTKAAERFKASGQQWQRDLKMFQELI